MNKNSRPWTVNQIKKMIDNGSLVFDNAIQRNFVWDKNRMSLLIDSLLRDYPVPAFYAITGDKKVTTPKGEVSVYDCIDGKQRCTTIYRYLNNQFKLTDLEPFMTDDGEVNISGMTYEELPEELQDTLKNAHLQVYSFDDISDEEIAEVMARLNNGKPLSAIDNTRIKAKDLPGIKALAEHKLFMEYLTEKARESHQAEELVIKSYMMITNMYESGLDNKYVRPVYENLVITDDIKTQLTQAFDNFYSVIKEIETKNASVVKKLMKKTHFISFIPTMTGEKNDEIVKNDAGIIISFFEEGKPSCSDEYNAACIHASNSAANIKIRQDEITKHINWYLREENPVEDEETA